MEGDGIAHLGRTFIDALTGRRDVWEVGAVGRVVGRTGTLDDDQLVDHVFPLSDAAPVRPVSFLIPACFKMLLRVFGRSSSLGFPGTPHQTWPRRMLVLTVRSAGSSQLPALAFDQLEHR